MEKRVFAFDLFISDSIGNEHTIEDMQNDMEWAELCDGQEAKPMGGDEIWSCIGLDDRMYHVFKKWTMLV